jgi:hypothetical protein
MIAFTSVKIDVVAPIPSARVSTAVAAKAGCFENMRAEWRRSCHRAVNAKRVAALAAVPSGLCDPFSGAIYVASMLALRENAGRVCYRS